MSMLISIVLIIFSKFALPTKDLYLMYSRAGLTNFVYEIIEKTVMF